MPLDLTAAQVSELAPGVHRVATCLYLHNKPPSRRSWVMIYASPVTGRRIEMGLGSADLLSVAQAKAMVLRHRVAVLEGQCPLTERRARRAALRRPQAVSFRQCTDLYLKAHSGSWRSARHASQWLSTMTVHVFPMLGSLPVAAIGTGEVMRILEPLWSHTPETASRVRGRIESVLDFAASRHWRTGDNPARWRGHLEHVLPKLAKLKPKQHLAALDWRELPALWRDLSLRTQTIPTLALRLVLLCGVRSNEALAARWDEFDLDAATWAIPAQRMKGGREHRVPLSGPALDVLRALATLRTGEHMFPSARHGRPLSGNRALEVLRALRPDAALTVHGFRSGLRDWCSEHAVPGEVAEACLAHAVEGRTQQAYRRGDLLEPRRAVMQRWADYLAGGNDANG